MNGFTKLYSGIINSSIWEEDTATRIVWITFLAMADSDGNVIGDPRRLAKAANVSYKDYLSALEKLTSPDLFSKTPDKEGRRIEPIQGGWNLINYKKYREKRGHNVASLEMEGYVYYVNYGEKVKIGFSKNPWARLSDLRVAIPGAQLISTEKGTLQLEKDRHFQFREYRLEGEWFSYRDELLDHITKLLKSSKKGVSSSDVATRSYEEAEAEAEAEADKEEEQKHSNDFSNCKNYDMAKARASLSMDLLCFAEDLDKSLKPNSKSQRQALLNLIQWLKFQIEEKLLNESVCQKILVIAKDSKSGRVPMAVFFSRLDKEIGYRARVFKEKQK